MNIQFLYSINYPRIYALKWVALKLILSLELYKLKNIINTCENDI